jgi:hypothetical protein
MPKIGAHVGFTYRIGNPESMNFAKVDVTIDEIDTELPLEKQLLEVNEALGITFKYLWKKIDGELKKVGSYTEANDS